MGRMKNDCCKEDNYDESKANECLSENSFGFPCDFIHYETPSYWIWGEGGACISFYDLSKY